MTSFLEQLNYADDICLFPELSAMVKSSRLTINCRKNKSLRLTRLENGLVQVGGEQIEAVDKLTYLGSEIDASGATDLDIESRIKEARSAFDILSAV